LKDNITFGIKEVSDETVFKIIKYVGLTQYVKELPNGIQTILQPDGKQISYTIAKKIVLARAIAKKPKVLILEDPLDRFNKEETKSIVEYLSNPSQPWTLIVVSSNPLWEQYTDEIINLEEGKLKE